MELVQKRRGLVGKRGGSGRKRDGNGIRKEWKWYKKGMEMVLKMGGNCFFKKETELV